ARAARTAPLRGEVPERQLGADQGDVPAVRGADPVGAVRPGGGAALGPPGHARRRGPGDRLARARRGVRRLLPRPASRRRARGRGPARATPGAPRPAGEDRARDATPKPGRERRGTALKPQSLSLLSLLSLSLLSLLSLSFSFSSSAG